MICILALIVFGILGIFSASYRVIAKEAFNCVFKKLTLRKCDTGLDTRLKSQITGSFLKFSPKLGRTIYRYFEVFSWALLILTLVTFYFMGQGVYFYAKYGNCNGENSNQFCIFDPLGTNKPQNTTIDSGEVCAIPGHNPAKTLTAPNITNIQHGISKGNPNAKITIIEFGCYSCHYTKLAEPTIQKVLDKYAEHINYVYIDFPLSLTHINAIPASEAAHCALDQGKYWEYREYLFANQERQFSEDLQGYAKELQLDEQAFNSCLTSGKYKSQVEDNYQKGLDSGISVTPTFFINNQTVVGAQEYSVFKKAIRQELGYSWYEFWRY